MDIVLLNETYVYLNGKDGKKIFKPGFENKKKVFVKDLWLYQVSPTKEN